MSQYSLTTKMSKNYLKIKKKKFKSRLSRIRS